jgi:hypothetical protein
MIKFEWGASKAASNKKKHGVTFEEAKSVFYDDFAIQFFDDENSEYEDILLICHCEEETGNLIRIISARKATSKERRLYKGKAS